jgi:hypothetical protein
MTGRLLGSDEGTANVDRNHPVEIRERKLIERGNYRYTGVIDQDIKPAECLNRLGDGAFYSLRLSAVGANCDRPSTAYFDGVHDLGGSLFSFDIGNGTVVCPMTTIAPASAAHCSVCVTVVPIVKPTVVIGLFLFSLLCDVPHRSATRNTFLPRMGFCS